MKHAHKTPFIALGLAVFVALAALMPAQVHAAGSVAGAILGGIADYALLLPGYIVAWLILPIMSLFVYVSGMILNFSIDYSVVHMAEYVRNAHIEETWRVIRDLANMGFIFVLIYTAMQTMFGKGNYQKVMKDMVIAALLINFSLFFTKAIIDASNVLSMFFYQAISPGGTSTTVGLASSFMSVLKIQNLYKISGGLEGTKLTIIGLAGIIIYLIVSFSFLAVALMFILRFMILLLVLALSPLMFVGSVIPGIKDKVGMWKDALFGQAMFGPLYFMLTWVTLKVSQGLFGSAQGDISAAILGSQATDGTWKAAPTTVAVLINFIIVIAFIITSALVAKSSAGKVGGFLTKTAMGWAGGATFGVAGRIGRGTLGRAGANLAESEWLKDKAAQGGMIGRAARLSMAAGEKTASSSFDVRGTSLVKGLDAGQAAKGGFSADLKNKVKAEKEFADKLKVSDVTIYRAEQALKAAEESGDEEAKQKAQAHLDELKGVSKKDVDKRHGEVEERRKAALAGNEKIKREAELEQELARKQAEAQNVKGGLGAKRAKLAEIEATRKQLEAAKAEAEAERKAINDKHDAEKAAIVETEGKTNTRKTQYAENLSTQRTTIGIPGTRFKREFDFDWTGRLGFLGPVKRENIAAADAIRKSAKAKTKDQEVVDKIKEMMEDGKKDEPKPTEGGTPPAAGGGNTGAPGAGGNAPTT